MTVTQYFFGKTLKNVKKSLKNIWVKRITLDIEEYLNNNPQKPYISYEYMHAMGNSCGGMHLYTELEEKYEMYQGWFI